MPTKPKRPVLSKKEIGTRVRALRLERGLSQVELAKIVGTHQTALSQIEVGRRGVSVQQVVKLSKALSVSPDRILGSDAPPPAKRLRDGRLLRRLEKIERLPAAKQRALLQILDAFIEKHAP